MIRKISGEAIERAGQLYLVEKFVRDETPDDVSHTVEQAVPGPGIRLEATKRRFLADGVDLTTVTATFVSYGVQDGEIVERQDAPAGSVTFDVNLRPVVVPITNGRAILDISTTVAGVIRVTAASAGYLPSGQVELEAIL